MPAAPRGRSSGALRQGERNIYERAQRTAGAVPGNYLRGYPRAVPGSARAISDWGYQPGYQLPLYGGLCGQGLLGRVRLPPGSPQSAIQRQDYSATRKSREQIDNASVSLSV